MAATAGPHEEAEGLFLRRESATTNAALWLVAGIGALVFAIVGFAIALSADVGQLSLHAMTTLPALLGIGALTAAWSTARTPTQVAVGPQGLLIVGRRGRQSYTWDQIGWATITAGALNHQRHLVIFDADGKRVAKLSEAFDDFDTMIELVKRRIADRGDDTAERIRRRKGKRSALIMAGVSIAMLAICGANVWIAYRQQRADRLLEEAAVPGEAEIVRRFLAPNGVTPRVEYRVTAPDGRTGTRNAEATRDYWDSLEEATSVPVLYVPDEPQISRLAEGEPENKENPVVMYVLSAVLALLCLLFLVAAALQWRGWDIDLDSKTGKISIKRFGTGT